jgi:3-phenylpropionate/cinnamic acid dioxygenase small subunit
VSEPADGVTEAEVRQVVDAFQVIQVLKRVAYVSDAGSLEEYAALLTADMVWEMPHNPLTGVAAQTRRGQEDVMAGVVERRATGSQGPESGTRHVVDTIQVEADRGTAVAVSSWQFYVGTDGSPRLVSMGSYRDELRRVDGSWRLAARRITLG